MRRLAYAVILGLLLVAPVKRVDVGSLLPVEAVAVYIRDRQVVVETDTGNLGVGASGLLALADLRENAPAVIYLDTVRYLLVAPEAEQEGAAVLELLKPSVRVHRCNAAGRVAELTRYLDVHA